MMKLILFVLVFLSNISYAQTSPESVDEWVSVKVAFINQRPLLYKNQRGRPTGIIHDLLEEVSIIEGFEVEYVDCQISECINLLRASLIDIIPIAFKRDERFKGIKLSRHFLFADGGSLFTADPKYIKGFDALRGIEIGVIKDSYQEHHLQNYISINNFDNKLIQYSNPEQLLKDVESKKLHIAVLEKFAGHIFSYGKNIRKMPIEIGSGELKFAFAPKMSEDIVERFNTQLELLNSPDGVDLFEIIKVYLSFDDVKKFPWQILLGGIVLILIITLIAILMIHIKRLRVISDSAQISIEKFSNALIAGEFGHFEWHINTGRVRASKKCLAILGFSKTNAPNSMETLLDNLQLEDDNDTVKHLRDPELLDARFYRMEAELDSKKGRRWVYFSGKKLHQNPSVFFGFVRDITQEKIKDENINQLNETLKKHIFKSG